MEGIKRNDIVYAVFARDDIFQQMENPKIQCRVIRWPAGPGDTLELQRLDNDGFIKINQNTPDFIGLEFIERPNREWED